MQSKRSFFNKSVYRKNLTRFAPVMVLYTLCLILGLAMMQLESVRFYDVRFWFASYMGMCIQVMGVVNLFFGPLMAMLLFGDLFNSRMCNALHAMPMTRESYFGANVLSGLTFSLIPTAIMTVLSMPLLNATCVQNAWMIGILWFVAANLEFICFFGMAVFCVFCTGSRFAMGLVYAAINGGACVVYGLLDWIYVPMLYGVITPDRWMYLLTPVAQMVEDTFVEVENFNNLLDLFAGRESEIVADFWVNESYYSLVVWAIIGIAFLVIGLLLYRRRNLECAGDAIAIPALKPVFLIACAVSGAALGAMAMEMFFGSARMGVMLYVFAGCGLVVGWFAGWMVLERNTRVFGLKSWKGLGILIAAAAVSLVLTYFDVLDLDDWTPKAEKVASVTLYASGSEIELTEQEDIEKIIQLQEMALVDRLEGYGPYPLSYIESLPNKEVGAAQPDGDGFYYGEGGYDRMEEHLYADRVYITYKMNSGREVQRGYIIWANLEEGDIVKEYLSRWDVVYEYGRRGWYDEFDVNRVFRIRTGDLELKGDAVTPEMVESLLAAIQADCEAGTMMQGGYYHDGRVRWYDEETQEYDYGLGSSISIYSYTGSGYDITGMDFNIFADSENTLNWLREHDLLDFEVVEGSFIS